MSLWFVVWNLLCCYVCALLFVGWGVLVVSWLANLVFVEVGCLDICVVWISFVWLVVWFCSLIWVCFVFFRCVCMVSLFEFGFRFNIAGWVYLLWLFVLVVCCLCFAWVMGLFIWWVLRWFVLVWFSCVGCCERWFDFNSMGICYGVFIITINLSLIDWLMIDCLLFDCE